MKNRIILDLLLRKSQSRLGRIVGLTGARQTGKTTIVRQCFPEHAYISLDDPLARPEYAGLSVPEWHERYPQAVLDEIQKMPQLFDSLKGLHDRYEDCRYVVTGSSQILLLDNIRESLAGRLKLIELFPLTLSESLTTSWHDPVLPSRMIQCLRTKDFSQLGGITAESERFARALTHWERYLKFGAYPAISEETDEEIHEWLHDYVQTYLQRDIRDLAQIRDLEPFVLAQRASAHMTGQITNFTDIARAASIAPQTAKRFIQYLQISYQVFLLQPWFRNEIKRLRKSPKLHYLDPGIMRAITGRRGTLSGHEYESAVVAEIYKQIRSHAIPAQLYHLSTVDGREVDLLIELETGYVVIEVKQSARIHSADARHLRDVEDILDKPALAKIIISNDKISHLPAPGIRAIHAADFLS